MRIHLADPETLILRVADKLEAMPEMAPPPWAPLVKTGIHKERAPTQDNWWHIRAASILRTVALKGPVGTSKLRIQYGGRKNRGHKPDAFRKGSGSIPRKILQQLEAAKLVKQDTVKGHKGRVVTPLGQQLLDKTANEVVK